MKSEQLPYGLVFVPLWHLRFAAGSKCIPVSTLRACLEGASLTLRQDGREEERKGGGKKRKGKKRKKKGRKERKEGRESGKGEAPMENNSGRVLRGLQLKRLEYERLPRQLWWGEGKRRRVRKVTCPKARPRRAGDLGRTQNVFLITFHAPRKGAPFKFYFKSLLLCWVTVHMLKALFIHVNFLYRVEGQQMGEMYFSGRICRKSKLGSLFNNSFPW